MTLRDCPAGHEVLLRRAEADPVSRRRLAALGLVAGARLRLVARGPAGGLIVAVEDGRVALDGRTAAALIVEPAP
jgi:Fe2+ transport system protein FeoA